MRRVPCAILALMIGLVGIYMTTACIAAVTPAKVPEITDIDIAYAVKAELLADEAVSAHLIDVQAKKGVVTLSGSVDNLVSKERATIIAESIKGVRSVVNLIEVRPVERGDEEILKDVVKALALDPAADAYELKVEVDGGKVTISGTVDSWQERHLAVLIAKGVKGIREVKDEITVEYKEDRPSQEIMKDVRRRLSLDPYIDDEGIEVMVRGGTVTLSGTVGNAAQRRYAYYDARVTGVSDVDTTGLRVETGPFERSMKKRKYVVKSDQEIQQAIRDAFVYDPRVWAFEIDTKVNKGVVTLTGVVDNLKAKRAAGRDAGNTNGVVEVNNHIKVRPVNPPSDEELQKHVRDALERDPFIDRHDINVVVLNEKVHLYGSVDNQYEKLRAESLGSRIIGVAEVKNLLSVHYTWPRKSDREIKEDIEGQFFWSLYVDGDDFSLGVEDGVVTLSGIVDSMLEMHAAIENAFEGGAKAVRSRIHVKEAPYYYPEYYTYGDRFISN
ncbi:MAG: BON domain-containing protein [bacterium]